MRSVSKTKGWFLNPTYIYIYSSLKDSYISGDSLYAAFQDGVYRAPLKTFLKELSRCTFRRNLPVRYEILEGKDGSPTELRLILRCPPDWTPERFQEEALKLWKKNASVEEVISCHAEQSRDMDLTFLRKGWKGPRNLTAASA